MEGLLVRGAGRLITCAPRLGEGPLGVIERGALYAAHGEILWVGREDEIADEIGDRLSPDTVELDAAGAAVIPGLVDCHTHLVFAGDRSGEFAARVAGEPFQAGGVMETVRATRATRSEDLAALAIARLDRFLSHGVTTVEAKSGYGLDVEQELRILRVAATLEHPIDVVRTFMGAHVVPGEKSDYPDGYVEIVAELMLPKIGNLAEFCDVWCDDGAFTLGQARRILRAARLQGLGLKVHAEQLAHTGGASLAAEFGAVSADHLEHADEEDADALARSRTVAVLLPGASLGTGGPFAPARMLIDRGVRVALSTDFNPGTSYSENLQLMAALACLSLKMTPEEAILGITRHAALALAREGQVGSLIPGAACDLVVLDAENEIDLAYHYGVNLARAVVKRGAIVIDRRGAR